MVRSSRVVQPPVSGVPVAGATNKMNQSCQAFYMKFVDLTGRIKGVDINTKVNRLSSADTVLDLFDDPVSTNFVNFPGLDNLKTTVTVILIV